MKPDRPLKIDAPVVLNADPVPDVWWGEDGIDALLWADPPPYAESPTSYPAVGSSVAVGERS